MRVGIPKEKHAVGERRVAMVPDVAARLIAKGIDVAIEQGAGVAANQTDESYIAKQVVVEPDATSLYATADIVCKVRPPTPDEVGQLRQGTILVSMLQPATDHEIVAALAAHGCTAFSLDLLPRISRGQAMDVLSSQATVSGYAATLIAATRLPKFFPMFMTAAGTVPPAKVLVMGAGVAGLQAISTARRLGAVVRAYDVRSAAKEEVQSLGASFVELPLESQEGAGGYAKEQSAEFLARQRELIGAEVAAADVVITTAAIPGRQAPVLVTEQMVQSMQPGSVIVDLAAESGGNCELSQAGQKILVNGVLVYGAQNLPSSMAVHASFLYARNVAEFVGLIAPSGALELNFDDEIIDTCCVTHDGAVRHEAHRAMMQASS